MALPVLNDGVFLQNISADSDPFNLVGGYYAASCIASDYNSNVRLTLLGPDGETFLPIVDPLGTDVGFFEANSMITNFQLPPGTYQVAVDSSTAVYFQLMRVNI